jgi:AhpC/TSA family
LILHSLEISVAELKERTGWELKPEGACKGDICVPLPANVTNNGMVNLQVLADKLGMPVIHDETANLYAVGPEAGGKALTTAHAPDFSLPDLDGKLFRFSSLRGKKVVLVAWASW